ncbi:hypothetical protein DT019_37175 [Streptomyces sp. SDr-06]|nr:hypothetical protein DT019_37175 [Streptomyces sp. SDr-06]
MVGRDARITGGLRRHGGNRPLPLHKVMDSGNKGYASLAWTCRPGMPQSCKSHRNPGFGARNGGKQAWFRFCASPFGYATARLRPAGPHPGTTPSAVDHAERPLPVRTLRQLCCRGVPGRVTWIRQPRADSATPIRPP